MSDFRVKEPNLFEQLNQSLQKIDSTTPMLLTKVKSHLAECLKNVKIDIIETENEIKELRSKQRQVQQESNINSNPNNSNETGNKQKEGPSLNDLKKEESGKNQKLGELKNAYSSLEHLQIRFNSKETQFNKTISETQKGKQILNQFYEIAIKYVSYPKVVNTISKGNSQNNKTNNTKNFKGGRLIGDTFHFEKDQYLSQLKLDEIENNVKYTFEKGHKISINNISQSDFSILEKNGYTIQKIESNEYSAYKNIK
jgi:ribulose bisphosphate carboxylase small subunit